MIIILTRGVAISWTQWTFVPISGLHFCFIKTRSTDLWQGNRANHRISNHIAMALCDKFDKSLPVICLVLPVMWVVGKSSH